MPRGHEGCGIRSAQRCESSENYAQNPEDMRAVDYAVPKGVRAVRTTLNTHST
jgi:hypothetical protein